MSISRKKPATPDSDVKKKFTFLGILCAAIAVILVYQYWAASSLPPVVEKAKATPTKAGRIRADQLINITNSSTTTTVGQPKAQQVVNQELPGLLDLNSLENRANISANGDRNPFEYPPPPPPPPPTPKPPPTIKLNSISPTSVYAKTKAFEVVIRGVNLTEDMKIYLQGSPTFSKTIFVSDTEVKATVPESFFTNSGPLQFELKKPGQELSFFSNPVSINVISPQDPNSLFKMVGQFTDSDGKLCAVLTEASGGETKPIQVVKVKDPVFTTWEVISITKNKLEVKDVKQAIGVTWSVKMKDDFAGGNNIAANAVQASYDQAQYVDNGNPYGDPNGTINLSDALQNQNATGNSILGQTPEDIERNKQIQQQNFKMMNELMQKQREAIMRQREQLPQQPIQPFIKNKPKGRT